MRERLEKCRTWKRAQRRRERENEKTILDHTEGKKYTGERKKKKEQMPGKQRFDFLERKYEMEYVNSLLEKESTPGRGLFTASRD